jgi:hypothetical protein
MAEMQMVMFMKNVVYVGGCAPDFTAWTWPTESGFTAESKLSRHSYSLPADKTRTLSLWVAAK